jgi:putative component of toxin-antitoxin plasmid stabilization module
MKVTYMFNVIQTETFIDWFNELKDETAKTKNQNLFVAR